MTTQPEQQHTRRYAISHNHSFGTCTCSRIDGYTMYLSNNGDECVLTLSMVKLFHTFDKICVHKQNYWAKEGRVSRSESEYDSEYIPFHLLNEIWDTKANLDHDFRKSIISSFQLYPRSIGSIVDLFIHLFIFVFSFC